jgi:hypothetical protein
VDVVRTDVERAGRGVADGGDDRRGEGVGEVVPPPDAPIEAVRSRGNPDGSEGVEEHGTRDPESESRIQRDGIIPFQHRHDLDDGQGDASVDDDASLPLPDANQEDADEEHLHPPGELFLPALGDAESVADPHRFPSRRGATVDRR